MPVWREWLRVVIALGAGSICLLGGRAAARRSPIAGRQIAYVAATIAVIAAADHYAPVRRLIGEYVSRVGGEGTIACLALLTLIGVAVGCKALQVRKWLAVLGAVISFLVIAVFSTAPLYWHYVAQRLQANVPDVEGHLQQSTGITCAPAAAAMLAHIHGVRVSEGQLAEDAGSNPLVGTDEYALARALQAASDGRMQGRASILGYAEISRLHVPFVAYVRRPSVGGHAILVTSAEPTKVPTVDPLTGAQETTSAEEFRAEWTGVAVWLEK